MLGKFRRFFSTYKSHKRQPLHVEFNLTDYCNLNCKGCSHYSPLAPEEYLPLKDLEHAMKCISRIKNSSKIQEVFLIGGETLTYPDIDNALVLARRYFPETKLSVFTNGLLVPKMPESFWETCRKTNAVIALTRYPIKFDYDRIEKVCCEKSVKCEVFGNRGAENSFYKFSLDSERKQNGAISHFKCSSYGCLTVDKGKIFPCALSACVGHLNRKFGTDFRWEKGDYIEVEKIKKVSELEKLRKRSVPFCRYCRREQPTKYEPSRRTLGEWT